MRRLVAVGVLSLFVVGCYRVHERPAAGPVPDASVPPDALVPIDAAGCAAQIARPMRISSAPRAELFSWRWSGLSCVEERYTTERTNGRPVFPPTGCEGPSCAALFEHENDCATAYAACGARVEQPRRGPAFARAATPDIACGVETCTLADGCYFGVTPGCGPRERGWYGAGLACDDASDCAAGTTCCVSDDGAYVLSSCRATCEADEARSCITDGDCGGGFCCEALAHLPSVATSVGACTSRPCDPESHVDL